MTDRESKPTIHGFVDRIDDELSEPPLEDTEPPEERVPSDPPPSKEKRVDVPKLISAWALMSAALKATVRAVEKNEGDNKKTRTASTRTRWAVIVSVVVGVGAGYQYTAENNVLLQEIRSQQADMRNQTADIRKDSEATLRAVRAVAEALGAKIEADTSMHPIAEEAARKKAVEAQEEALAAEVLVAEDVNERAAASAKLETLRLRARTIRVEPEPLDVETTELVETGPSGVRQAASARPSGSSTR